MYNLRSILQHVVDGFYYVSFAQHHLVIERHQFVFHVHPQSGHQLYPVFKKEVKEPLRDIPLVSKQLAVQTFSQHLEHLRVFVADVCASEDKCNDLTPVIAGKVKFETMTPPHGALAVSGYTSEHLVGIAPEIMAYRYHRRINECNARASAESTEV